MFENKTRRGWKLYKNNKFATMQTTLTDADTDLGELAIKLKHDI